MLNWPVKAFCNCKEWGSRSILFSEDWCQTLKRLTPWGILALIIKRTKPKHKLPAEIIILVNIVRSWAIEQRAYKAAHKGLTSQMVAIEPYIVKIASQFTKIWVSISHAQRLQLLWHLFITVISTAEKVNTWKKNYCITCSRNRQRRTLENGYWLGFMKRYMAIKLGQR